MKGASERFGNIQAYALHAWVTQQPQGVQHCVLLAPRDPNHVQLPGNLLRMVFELQANVLEAGSHEGLHHRRMLWTKHPPTQLHYVLRGHLMHLRHAQQAWRRASGARLVITRAPQLQRGAGRPPQRSQRPAAGGGGAAADDEEPRSSKRQRRQSPARAEEPVVRLAGRQRRQLHLLGAAQRSVLRHAVNEHVLRCQRHSRDFRPLSRQCATHIHGRQC
mmetsp:Transcript_123821/g.361532  ORF Transcript_123821/g.361532 Transcript_123821/m.361532 type:complete len:219 (+) Transcript_123821:813-1469(+)